MLVDRHRRKLGPWAAHRSAAIKATHCTNAGLIEERDQSLQIARLDGYVAVGEHDDLVSYLPRHVDQVRDLAIGAVFVRIDHETDIGIGEIPDQRLDVRYRRVVGILYAENDLHRSAVVLPAQAGEIRAQAGFGAVQRLQDGHCRRRGGRRQRSGGETSRCQCVKAPHHRQTDADRR